MSANPELSVVVIGRNEADKICGCLEAILDATKGLQPEILYVDSNSTDGTVEAASKYNITVLALHEQWVLSAAAGRYIGTINSRADYILFCDGDIQVSKKWVMEALAYIKNHPDVGGVGGFVVNRFPDDTNQKAVPILRLLANKNAEASVCKSLSGGACIYRRDALEQAGHFNPYLYAEEEWDLAQRIRAAGFNLVQLPLCAGHHFTVKRLSHAGVLKRTKIYDCYGQLVRLRKGRRGFWWEFLTGPMRYILGYNGAFVILAAIAVVSGLIGANIWWLISPLIMILIIAVFYTFRRRSVVAFPLFLFRSAYTLWRTIIVLAIYKPMTAKDYPTGAKVIKRQSQ